MRSAAARSARARSYLSRSAAARALASSRALARKRPRPVKRDIRDVVSAVAGVRGGSSAAAANRVRGGRCVSTTLMPPFMRACSTQAGRGGDGQSRGPSKRLVSRQGAGGGAPTRIARGASIDARRSRFDRRMDASRFGSTALGAASTVTTLDVDPGSLVS
eukprot:scaffold292126_cov28-Tisochrysis_lutea.AAC.2